MPPSKNAFAEFVMNCLKNLTRRKLNSSESGVLKRICSQILELQLST